MLPELLSLTPSSDISHPRLREYRMKWYGEDEVTAKTRATLAQRIGEHRDYHEDYYEANNAIMSTFGFLEKTFDILRDGVAQAGLLVFSFRTPICATMCYILE